MFRKKVEIKFQFSKIGLADDFLVDSKKASGYLKIQAPFQKTVFRTQSYICDGTDFLWKQRAAKIHEVIKYFSLQSPTKDVWRDCKYVSVLELIWFGESDLNIRVFPREFLENSEVFLDGH